MTYFKPSAQKHHGEAPLACNLAAIPAERRAEHGATAEYLFGTRVVEMQELHDGYAFHFASDDYVGVAQFVADERLCCPFFNFVVEVMPNQGPVWLRITGQVGAKLVLLAELGLPST